MHDAKYEINVYLSVARLTNDGSGMYDSAEVVARVEGAAARKWSRAARAQVAAENAVSARATAVPKRSRSSYSLFSRAPPESALHSSVTS